VHWSSFLEENDQSSYNVYSSSHPRWSVTASNSILARNRHDLRPSEFRFLLWSGTFSPSILHTRYQGASQHKIACLWTKVLIYETFRKPTHKRKRSCHGSTQTFCFKRTSTRLSYFWVRSRCHSATRYDSKLSGDLVSTTTLRCTCGRKLLTITVFFHFLTLRFRSDIRCASLASHLFLVHFPFSY
jgi:hypothetical protein